MGKSFNSKKANQQELLFAFRKFDLDNDGVINRQELQTGFKNYGMKISLYQADQIIEEVDQSEKGAVCFEDFCSMMAG